MGTVDDLIRELTRTNSISELGALVVRAAVGAIGVSGVNVFPLFDGAIPESEAVMYSSEHPERWIKQKTLEIGFPLAEQDIGPLPALFAGDRHLFDVNEYVGWTRLRQTQCYNEYWRPCGIERQVLAVLRGEHNPVGFICMCRRRTDPEFDAEDCGQLERIRSQAEAVLRRIVSSRSGWLGLDAVLHVFRVGLPFPCGVFDHLGNALWLNEAAERMLGARVVTTGARPIVCGSSASLETWKDTAREADIVSASSEPQEVAGLVVRRIDRSALPPIYLLVAQGGATAHHDLTRRERDVAELAARGYSTLNIALQLSVSEGTVRNYLKKVYRKLRIGSRAELAQRMWGC